MDRYEPKGLRLYERTLVVIGNLHFPVDMLRYDNCIPAGEGDANEIERSLSGDEPIKIRVIELKIVLREKKRQPTIARWNSMGWMVLEFDGTEMVAFNERGDQDKLMALYWAYQEERKSREAK